VPYISRNQSHRLAFLPLLPIFIQSFLVGYAKRIVSARVRIGRSRSSKVIGFGTNRKRVCDFLLVRYSNLGPILPRFRCIAGFVLMTPPLFHHNFACIPVGTWTRSPMFGSIRARTLSYSAVKLFSKYSNLCDHGTWTWTSQTDRQTDDILWHNRARL